jgi:hypothetical protein
MNILSNNHQSAEMGNVIDKIDQSRKGKFVNIKENIYVYLYKNNLLKKNKGRRNKVCPIWL